MSETLKLIELRELIRQLERKLGILQESQQSFYGTMSCACGNRACRKDFSE